MHNLPKKAPAMTKSKRNAGLAMVAGASLIALICPNAFAQSSYFGAMGDALERALPSDARTIPATFLSPGTKIMFDGVTYAIRGTDPCPDTGQAGCVIVTSGVKSVSLNPIRTNDWLRGAVSFTRTGTHQVSIALLAAIYPSGQSLTIPTPPPIGLAPSGVSIENHYQQIHEQFDNQVSTYNRAYKLLERNIPVNTNGPID